MGVGTMPAHSPFNRLWPSKYCVQRDCCWKNHAYRLGMNGTITIKTFSLYSLPFHIHSTLLCWMSWIYIEGNWGELGQAQLTPTPFDSSNPRTLWLFWKCTLHIYYEPPSCDHEFNRSRNTHWYVYQVKARQIAPLIHRVTIKYSRVKNHFWYLKTRFCHLKTGLSSEHDESRWTSRQCLCTSMIGIWLICGWKWRKY